MAGDARQTPAQMAACWPGLSALQGVRALANLCIINMHVVLLLLVAAGSTMDVNAILRSNPLASALNNAGPLGVETFFVLTGLFVAWPLVPALEALPAGASPWPLLRSYYCRRAARIGPALAVSSAIKCAWMFPLSAGLPAATDAATASAVADANAGGGAPAAALAAGLRQLAELTPAMFYEPHRFPMFRSIGYLWSLRIQIQMYILLPLLLATLRPACPGFRRRVALLGWGMVAASVWVRVHASLSQGWHYPYAQIYGMGTPESTAAGFANFVAALERIYFPTTARMGSVGAGLLLALALMRDPERAATAAANTASAAPTNGKSAAATSAGAVGGASSHKGSKARAAAAGGGGRRGVAPMASLPRSWAEYALSTACKVVVTVTLVLHHSGPRADGRVLGGPWVAAATTQFFPYGPGFALCLAVLLQDLVLCRTWPACVASKIHESRAALFLGDLSYSAYLLHVMALHAALRWGAALIQQLQIRGGATAAAAAGAEPGARVGEGGMQQLPLEWAAVACAFALLLPTALLTYAAAWVQWRAVELPAARVAARLSSNKRKAD